MNSSYQKASIYFKETSPFVLADVEILYAGEKKPKPNLLDLFQSDLMPIFLGFIKPIDAMVLLLFLCRETYNSAPSWTAMLRVMKLDDIYKSSFCSEIGLRTTHPRDFVIYSFNNLRYNCTNCYVPLDQSSGTCFIFSANCKSCSLLELSGKKVIEKKLKFSVCGNISLTCRGWVSKDPPFWIPTDLSSRDLPKNISAFELAYYTSKEKVR
jgi:hypothetical protein